MLEMTSLLICSATRINLQTLYRYSWGEWIFHFRVQRRVTQIHTFTYKRAQQVNQRTYSTQFSFFLFILPQYQITWVLFNYSSCFWLRFTCMMLTHVACFKSKNCKPARELVQFKTYCIQYHSCLDESMVTTFSILYVTLALEEKYS